jgi:hypothetical protein
MEVQAVTLMKPNDVSALVLSLICQVATSHSKVSVFKQKGVEEWGKSVKKSYGQGVKRERTLSHILSFSKISIRYDDELATDYVLVSLMAGSNTQFKKCLNGSTQGSACSEAPSPSAYQEIPRILWKVDVHYLFHNSPKLVPIQSQMMPSTYFRATYLKSIFI